MPTVTRGSYHLDILGVARRVVARYGPPRSGGRGACIPRSGEPCARCAG